MTANRKRTRPRTLRRAPAPVGKLDARLAAAERSVLPAWLSFGQFRVNIRVGLSHPCKEDVTSQHTAGAVEQTGWAQLICDRQISGMCSKATVHVKRATRRNGTVTGRMLSSAPQRRDSGMRLGRVRCDSAGRASAAGGLTGPVRGWPRAAHRRDAGGMNRDCSIERHWLVGNSALVTGREYAPSRRSASP